MAKGQRRAWILLSLIVAGAAFFRLYGIHYLAWFIDEGLWGYGSAMAIKHGVWWPHGWRWGYLSPFYTRLLYPLFLVFGPTIPVSRYFSVVLGLASVISIFFLCARLGYSRNVCLLSALFLSFNGLFAQINRYALTDTLLTLLIIWFMFALAGTQRKTTVAGLLLGLAILTKMTAIFAGAVAYFYDVFISYRSEASWKKYLRSAAIPAGGFLFAALVFLALYILHPRAFADAWHVEIYVERATGPIASGDLQHVLIDVARAMPFALIFGLAGFVDALRRRSKEHALPLYWLICSLAVILPQHNPFPRYYMPIIPPLCIMAAWLIDAMLLSKPQRLTRICGAAAVILLCLHGPASWYYHVTKYPDTTGPDVVRWMRLNLSPDTGVMGMIAYGCSPNVRYYPQETYCHHRLPTRQEIDRFRISYVVLDDAELKHLESQMACRFRFVRRMGTATIWRIRPSANPGRNVNG